MKTKTIITLLVAFIAGTCVQLYLGNYQQNDGVATMIETLIGGGLGLMVGYALIPFILCSIIYLVIKKFPHDTFMILTFIMTILLSIVLVK